MEATDLGIDPKTTGAAVKRRELCNTEVQLDNIESLEDRHLDRHSVVERH
jgi:hypothetical protein